jgi:hypothetical protein
MTSSRFSAPVTACADSPSSGPLPTDLTQPATGTSKARITTFHAWPPAWKARRTEH